MKCNAQLNYFKIPREYKISESLLDVAESRIWIFENEVGVPNIDTCIWIPD